MKKESIENIAALLKGLDFCMLTTNAGSGVQDSRPMSNNGDVKYDGTSYFFTYDSSAKVKQIEKDCNVSLQYVSLSTFGKNLFVNVAGQAKIIKDKDTLKKHWIPSLKIWFPDGLDTKGIALLAIDASRIHFWHGTDEGVYES